MSISLINKNEIFIMILGLLHWGFSVLPLLNSDILIIILSFIMMTRLAGTKRCRGLYRHHSQSRGHEPKIHCLQFFFFTLIEPFWTPRSVSQRGKPIWRKLRLLQAFLCTLVQKVCYKIIFIHSQFFMWIL